MLYSSSIAMQLMKFGIYLPILVILIATIPHVNAETTPDWVKNTAGWWATDAISETEFVNAVEFLVNEGIISVTTNTSSSEFYHHTLPIGFSHMFGEFGKEPGQFYKPAGIAVDEEGKVHVADFYNDRIQIFDQNGNFDSK